jgi:hypothetical protein
MAITNVIKLAQLATGELAAFINSGLGVTTGTNIIHSQNEQFLLGIGVAGDTTMSGNLSVLGVASFQSGLTVQTGIQVFGEISGQSLRIDNFSIPTGAVGVLNVGSLALTGLPLYDSGNLASGMALPSGSVFGVKQLLNQPRFGYDASGNLQPFTGVGATVYVLCMSTGA